MKQQWESSPERVSPRVKKAPHYSHSYNIGIDHHLQEEALKKSTLRLGAAIKPRPSRGNESARMIMGRVESRLEEEPFEFTKHAPVIEKSPKKEELLPRKKNVRIKYNRAFLNQLQSQQYSIKQEHLDTQRINSPIMQRNDMN